MPVGQFFWLVFVCVLCVFLCFNDTYGGYRKAGSEPPFCNTAFKWLNVSNPYFPWYAPMPEFPTPPNGSSELPQCMQTSLTHAPPLEVRLTMLLASACFESAVVCVRAWEWCIKFEQCAYVHQHG